MQTVDSLKQRYTEVRQRIDAAAKRGGTDPARVVLVAVSKYAPLEDVRELIALGHRDFGENQVQQLVQRSAMISEFMARQRAVAPGRAAPSVTRDAVRWHMVGHLQRNKVRKAVDVARLIHSVDSLRVAEEIQAAALRTDATVEVLIQVNVSGETSKHGLAPASINHVLDMIDTMVNLRVRGMMTMAPHDDDAEAARVVFVRTRELFEEVQRLGTVGPHFNILSMGMSGDYEVAVEEGANLVRVGSSIFGPPPPENAEQSEHDPEGQD